MEMVVGLDVHRKWSVYCALDGAGTVIGEGRVASTEEGYGRLAEHLGCPPGTRIGLETGCQADWAAATLHRRGLRPVVIEASEVRAKARRKNQKSDRRDAFEIADGMRRDLYVSIVYMPPPPIRRLRELLSRRRHFVGLRTGQVNAAKFLIRARGLAFGERGLAGAKAWDRRLATIDDPELRTLLEMHRQVWLLADEKVRRLDRAIEQAAAPYRDLADRLMTLPGVGPITAVSFVATVGDASRFADGGRLASYLGLVPSAYDSGSTERHGSITKRGSGPMRSLLVECAHQAAKPTHPLNPYFRKTAAAKGYRVAVVLVAHRMARILYRMWRDERDFDVTRLNVECRPLQRTKRYEYRLKAAD